MTHKEAINKITSVIRIVAPQAKVILFGSRARGDARNDSDYDILILEDVESLTYARRKEITYPLYQLYYDYGIDVQPIVKTISEWNAYPFKTPFYNNIVKEGIFI